nr:hypothetical protein CFP56_74740 [Quercus suber]
MAEREESLGSALEWLCQEVRLQLGAKLRQLSWVLVQRLVGAPEVSPLGVPRKWILKGEAPSHEIAWVPAAFGIMDLRFQWKENLLVPIQFLCPCGITVGWSNWVEQEVADEGFCQILKNFKILKPWLCPVGGTCLFDEESAIARKLLETFGGTSASWTGNKARFSFWISEFRESEVVDFMKPFTFPLFVVLSRGVSLPLGTLCLGTLYSELDRLHSDELEGSPCHIIESSVNVVLLQTFIWEHSKDYVNVGKDVGDVKMANWVVQAAGPNGELQFLGFEDGLPLLMKWMGLKNLGFAKWHTDLNGWVVYGGNVPIEWSEKNTIVRAPESNLATNATKRSCGKSPPSKDKPKKVRCKKPSAEKSKTGSSKPPAISQFGSVATLVTKSSVPAIASVSTLFPLKQYRRKTSAGKVKFGDSEETQSEEYDFEDTTADFGPTDEDIEIVDEGLAIVVTTGEVSVEMPSPRHVASLATHDVHQSKKPPGMIILKLWSESSSVAIKRISLEEFLEQFAKDEENEKVAADFYPLSSNTVMF